MKQPAVNAVLDKACKNSVFPLSRPLNHLLFKSSFGFPFFKTHSVDTFIGTY